LEKIRCRDGRGVRIQLVSTQTCDVIARSKFARAGSQNGARQLTLDQLIARDWLVFDRAVEDLFDSREIARVELMKANGLPACCGAELYGERDHPEGDMAFPNTV
jgi:hypothetical protein